MRWLLVAVLVFICLAQLINGQTDCQSLYTFEGSTGGWYAYTGSGEFATGVFTSSFYASEGNSSLGVAFKTGGKATYKVEGPLDMSGYRYIQFNMKSLGGIAYLSLFVESDTFTESSLKTVVAGQRIYTFDLQALTWRSANTAWKYSGAVQSLQSIQRLGIIFYNTTSNNAYIDNVRQCLAASASNSVSRTPSRSPVVNASPSTTPSFSWTATPSLTPSLTPRSASPSSTVSNSPTFSLSSTPFNISSSPTVSNSPTLSNSPTMSYSPTVTLSPTPSLTPPGFGF